MTARLIMLLAVTGLLAACNTGESVFEWDEETAAIIAEREAAAEAAEAEAEGEGGADAAPVMDAAVGLVVPMAILRDSGELELGDLSVA